MNIKFINFNPNSNIISYEPCRNRTQMNNYKYIIIKDLNNIYDNQNFRENICTEMRFLGLTSISDLNLSKCDHF